MFRRLPDAPAGEVPFTLDGEPANGREGDTVAAALLALGRRSFRRTAVSGAERGPWCLMGVCHDCLVTVDGAGNVQGCLVPLRAGMAVETGRGRREVGR
jgi:D-hydroxyproline dehydrogenase subunit gamma